jgi:membrane-associated HD superfamily phosphohydrolase
MDYNYQQSQFSRAMLTGLFVGIVATMLCLVYNIIYRESTGFQPADFINVSSLIFVVNLVFWVIGIIYFICLKLAKKGDLIFEVLFVLLTIFCIWKTEFVQRAANHELTAQFRGLLLGIIIIMAIGAFLIPYLFHSKKFEEHVV